MVSTYRMQFSGLALLATLGINCADAWARQQPEAPVITQHSILVHGKPLRYLAEAGRVAIRDVDTGEAHGYIFYTAYRLAASGTTARPLTFVWNGGPGADSSTLQFGLAGPKRSDGAALVDNADTLLTDSDLVFVDPVGTGFSRPAKADYAQEFYGTVGDVASVTEFVRAWRLLHRAEDAPLYLLGESWGAGRAGSVGYALQKRGIAVSGLVLISGGAGLHTEYVPRTMQDALRIADFAVASYYHGKLPAAAGANAAAVRHNAEQWARATYAPALERADTLSDAERTEVIAGLMRYTGVGAAQIDSRTLAFLPRPYRKNLLDGKTLDMMDLRRTAAPDDRAASAILRYFRRDLGYATTAPHVGLERIEQGYAPGGKYPEEVGMRWNYATAAVTEAEMAAAIAVAQTVGEGPPKLGPPLPSTEELLALNPDVKILVAAGQYDSLNHCTVNSEIAARMSGPIARAMHFKCYAGGHMMYHDAVVRRALSDDVKALFGAAH